MQNNFRELEALVFFDLWIPDSGLRIQDSGFRFLIPASGFRIPDSGFRFPVSGFRFPGFRVALFSQGNLKAATLEVCFPFLHYLLKAENQQFVFSTLHY